ncbi:MAG: hypothetical protein ACSLE1_15690 [Sphingobium sp.]
MIVATNSQAWDTVALIGSNLRATDTIRIRSANSAAATSATPLYDSGTNAAWTAPKPSLATAKSILKLPAARTDAFIRIDITATGHPAGYVQAQRLLFGKAITTDGVDASYEIGFEDQSVPYSGPGWQAFDEYPVLMTAKAKMSWLSDLAFRADWADFLQVVGQKKAFLFVPFVEAPDRIQTEAMFATITSKVSVPRPNSDNWIVELAMRSLAL